MRILTSSIVSPSFFVFRFSLFIFRFYFLENRTCDVKYTLGGTEKNVEWEFVTAYSNTEVGGKRDRRARDLFTAGVVEVLGDVDSNIQGGKKKVIRKRRVIKKKEVDRKKEGGASKDAPEKKRKNESDSGGASITSSENAVENAGDAGGGDDDNDDDFEYVIEEYEEEVGTDEVAKILDETAPPVEEANSVMVQEVLNGLLKDGDGETVNVDALVEKMGGEDMRELVGVELGKLVKKETVMVSEGVVYRV